ncbi:MAG: tRNA-binding protein [Candidatus Aenigmarchaeota archaeon]|nr:tRNA-binding protein [Candidatus Aenigmarchaeota archaeon]
MITFDEFQKVDIRIGKIISIEDAETRKPMFRIKLDFGELGTKTAIAGLKGFYEKEDLEGKMVAAVVNLEPRKMGPEVSECMIMAAVTGEDEKVSVLNPQSDIDMGSKVY